MSISLGSSALTDLRLGTSQVSAAYLGTSLVYQTSSVTSSTWTPAQLTGIKYYFTAGAGTTLVSGRVSEWVDQISSVSLTATTSASAYWPQYISAEPLANNKPALYFSSGSSRTTERLQNLVLGTGIADADDLTIIGIIIPNSSYDSDYQIYGGVGSSPSGYNYETPLWIDSPGVSNQWGRYNYQSSGGANGNVSSGVSVVSNAVSWHAVVYNSASGSITQYINSSTAAQTTTGAPTNPTKSQLKLIAGDYSDGSNVGGIGIINGKILELIYTTKVPTATELDNLNTYVNTFYKLPQPARLPVSQSLWAYYDIAITSSYSGSGQTGITDLSGNGNNGSVDATLEYKNIKQGSSAASASYVLFNPVNASHTVNTPSITPTSFTMLVSWYGKNFNYTSAAVEVFVGRDPEAFGIMALESTYNYRTLNLVNDTYDSLTYMPVDSGTGSMWHISSFSYNSSNNNINWCMDGTTGSYTLSSPGAASSFGAVWNASSSGRYMGSGSMVQVLAFYTGSLTNDQLLQNYNGLKGRYL